MKMNQYLVMSLLYIVIIRSEKSEGEFKEVKEGDSVCHLASQKNQSLTIKYSPKVASPSNLSYEGSIKCEREIKDGLIEFFMISSSLPSKYGNMSVSEKSISTGVGSLVYPFNIGILFTPERRNKECIGIGADLQLEVKLRSKTPEESVNSTVQNKADKADKADKVNKRAPAYESECEGEVEVESRKSRKTQRKTPETQTQTPETQTPETQTQTPETRSKKHRVLVEQPPRESSSSGKALEPTHPTANSEKEKRRYYLSSVVNIVLDLVCVEEVVGEQVVPIGFWVDQLPSLSLTYHLHLLYKCYNSSSCEYKYEGVQGKGLGLGLGKNTTEGSNTSNTSKSTNTSNATSNNMLIENIFKEIPIIVGGNGSSCRIWGESSGNIPNISSGQLVLGGDSTPKSLHGNTRIINITFVNYTHTHRTSNISLSLKLGEGDCQIMYILGVNRACETKTMDIQCHRLGVITTSSSTINNITVEGNETPKTAKSPTKTPNKDIAKMNAGIYMLIGLLVFVGAVGGWMYYVCKQENKGRGRDYTRTRDNNKNRNGKSPQYRELVSIKLS